MTEEILEYIKKTLKEGFSDEKIIEAMKGQGWEESDIKKYLQQAKKEAEAPAKEEEEVSAEERPKEEVIPEEEKEEVVEGKVEILKVIKQNILLLSISAAVFIILVGVIAVFTLSGEKPAETPEVPLEKPPETTPETPPTEQPPIEIGPKVYATPTEMIKDFIESYKKCELEEVKKFYKEGETPLRENQSETAWKAECKLYMAAVQNINVVSEESLSPSEAGEARAKIVIEFCIKEGECAAGEYQTTQVEGNWKITPEKIAKPVEATNSST